MLFEIKTKDKTLFYDNQASSLTGDVDYTLAKQFVKPYVPQIYQVANQDSMLVKKLPIRHLRIQLGTKCNYKCSFCVQHEYKDDQRFPPIKQVDDTIALVSRITTEDANIEFWGGEPFVYWKILELLIVGIRNRRPRARLFMISNGSLMTKQKLEILLNNKVNLLFSHDGPAYHLRGPDPTEDPKVKDLWYTTRDAYAEHGLSFGLNTVISQYNCDLFEMDAWFTKNLDIDYKYEGCVITHSPNSIEFTNFTEQQKQVLWTSVQKAILGQHNNPRISSALSHWVRHILRHLVYHIPVSAISGKCDVLKPQSVSIDLYGNLLSCHNVDSSQVVGLTKNIGSTFLQESRFTHWSLRPKCKDCYALLSCRGNCMRNNEYLHEQGCEVQRVFHSALMDATIGLLAEQVVEH